MPPARTSLPDEATWRGPTPPATASFGDTTCAIAVGLVRSAWRRTSLDGGRNEAPRGCSPCPLRGLAKHHSPHKVVHELVLEIPVILEDQPDNLPLFTRASDRVNSGFGYYLNIYLSIHGFQRLMLLLILEALVCIQELTRSPARYINPSLGKELLNRELQILSS
jgi:hypothetical protein